MTLSKMVKKSQKSKVDAFIPKMMDSAYDMEKLRCNYLRQCSEHYNKKLYDCLMQLKSFWMMMEKNQVALEISGNEYVDEHIKNSVLRRKLYRQQEPKKQEKKKSTGRRRGRPRKKGQKVKFVDDQAAE